MPIITIPKAKMLEGALLPPSWYDLEIIEIRVHTKNGNTMYFTKFLLMSHPDKPEVTILYNDFNMDEFTEMWAAAQGKTVQELVEATEVAMNIDTDDACGMKLKGNLVHKTRADNGEINNHFSEYIPAGVTNPL